MRWRGRRSSGFRIIGGDLAVRSRHQADRAFGVVAPAVRIRVFFAACDETADLIFQARAVVLIDDRRRDEDQQVALRAGISSSWNKYPSIGMSPSTGTLVRALGISSWSRPPIASVSPLLIKTFESSVRVSMTGLATVAPAKTKVASPTLLLISGCTVREIKLSLLMDGVTISVLPNFLSSKPPKTAWRFAR